MAALALDSAVSASTAEVVAPPDVVVVRLEIDDSCTFPQGSADFVYMAMQGSGTDSTPLPVGSSHLVATGQRKIRQIEIETYFPGQTDKLQFFSGIPSVEVTKGILHLYKLKGTSSLDTSSEVLCALTIPAHQHLPDMLDFLSPVLATITSLRVIRDSTPNQYMLLMVFKDKDSARQVYLNFNGRPFNSIESAVCRLVYVQRVEIMKSSQTPASLPSDLVELPSCPVCLEKLDDSILTVLCNHSFHMQCLTRWEDATCPICRYTQTPEPCNEENTCSACDSKEDLWICLICGNIGCGRYVGGHAHTHFLATQHTFSMQLGKTQRVWDYIGDYYVHRLVQNKGDGKLVEVGGGGSQGLLSEEKVDSLQLEYSYLLTSQLESQRLYFEDKMAHIEKELTEQLQLVESRCRSTVSEKELLESKVSNLEKEKKANEKKLTQQQTRLTKLTSELKEEKEMNKCLSTNQKLWRDRVEALEGKIDVTIQQKEREMKELQEQVRDLMFYLETQKKVEASPEDTRQELQKGHVMVPVAAPVAAQTSTPSRKQRKKK